VSKPLPFVVTDITHAEQDAWIAEHGALWADIVEPETQTTEWGFHTLADAKAWALNTTPDGPSGYCSGGGVVERRNIHLDEYRQWEWVEVFWVYDPKTALWEETQLR
jgi:hypothetical protein